MDKNYLEPRRDEIVSIKEWLITILIMSIPIVNIVMMFVWAFGGTVKESKANYFKASLIMAAIGILIAILLYGVMGSIAMSKMLYY